MAKPIVTVKLIKEKTLLTTSEVARVLNVTTKTVIRYCNNEKNILPHIHYRGTYRFSLKDVLLYKRTLESKNINQRGEGNV